MLRQRLVSQWRAPPQMFFVCPHKRRQRHELQSHMHVPQDCTTHPHHAHYTTKQPAVPTQHLISTRLHLLQSTFVSAVADSKSYKAELHCQDWNAKKWEKECVTSSRAVTTIAEAFSWLNFPRNSLIFSFADLPVNSNGWGTTGATFWAGLFFQILSTRFSCSCTSFCPCLANAGSHRCAVSTDMHDGSTPTVASFSRFYITN